MPGGLMRINYLFKYDYKYVLESNEILIIKDNELYVTRFPEDFISNIKIKYEYLTVDEKYLNMCKNIFSIL